MDVLNRISVSASALGVPYFIRLRILANLIRVRDMPSRVIFFEGSLVLW